MSTRQHVTHPVDVCGSEKALTRAVSSGKSVPKGAGAKTRGEDTRPENSRAHGLPKLVPATGSHQTGLSAPAPGGPPEGERVRIATLAVVAAAMACGLTLNQAQELAAAQVEVAAAIVAHPERRERLMRKAALATEAVVVLFSGRRAA